MIKAHLRKQEKSYINNLIKELEKDEQTKLKVSRRKEIINIKAGINKIETNKTTEKINETKNWFFEKIKKKKISKLLADLSKEKER